MPSLLLKKPESKSWNNLTSPQLELDFNYPEVGATSTDPPQGYTVDTTLAELGSGEQAFLKAKQALQHWQNFGMNWLAVSSPENPPEVGRIVAIVGKAMGFWWLNCCRVIYMIDSETGVPHSGSNESSTVKSYGFAYGTLPGHVAKGEEKFVVKWDALTDKVDYEITAFSKPNHFLSKIGYPYMRRLQKRFGRDSAKAMFAAVNGPDQSTRNLEIQQQTLSP